MILNDFPECKCAANSATRSAHQVGSTPSKELAAISNSGEHKIPSSGYCQSDFSRPSYSYLRGIFVEFLIYSIFFLSTLSSQTAPTGTPSAAAHPILVELFTSEGCSSCPPADALLEKLDDSQPLPGAQLIVLSEHVDYWDHDGWKDPASSPAMTERQDSYVHALGLQGPYTPQMIADGNRVVDMGDPQQIIKVLQGDAAQPKDLVRIDQVSVNAGSSGVLQARIEADGSSDKRNANIYVAIALSRVESQVLRGENGGQHLTHVAVVQQLTKIGKLQKGKSFDETVRLKLKSDMDPKNVRVVAFVQEPGPGKVLGAALWKPAT
jgi:hypothetical protein